MTSLLLTICVYRLVDDVQLYKAAQDLKLRKVEELQQLKETRDQKRELAEKLTSDPLTKERLARAEGYIKPGETVYFIQPPAKPAAPANDAAALTQ